MKEFDSQIFFEDIFDLSSPIKRVDRVEEITDLHHEFQIQEERISLRKEDQKFQETFMSEQSSSKKKPRQTNTNLLKNLVVTLRTWVKFEHLESTSTQRKLWEHFKKCTKINKNLILLVFGNEKPMCDKFNALIQNTESSINKCSLEELLNAQENIRSEVVCQLEAADIQFVLKNRRIRNKQQFDKYFYNFVQSIKKGGISHERTHSY